MTFILHEKFVSKQIRDDRYFVVSRYRLENLPRVETYIESRLDR